MTFGVPGDRATLGVEGPTLDGLETDDVPTFAALDGLAALAGDDGDAGVDAGSVAGWLARRVADELPALDGLLSDAGLAELVSPGLVKLAGVVSPGLAGMLALLGELATLTDAGDPARDRDGLDGLASCFWIFGLAGLDELGLLALDGDDGLGAAPDFDPLAGLLGDEGEYKPELEGLLRLVPVAGEADDDSDVGELLSGIGVACGGKGPASGLLS